MRAASSSGRATDEPSASNFLITHRGLRVHAIEWASILKSGGRLHRR